MTGLLVDPTWVPWIGAAAVASSLVLLAVAMLRNARQHTSRQLLVADRDVTGGTIGLRELGERTVRGLQQVLDQRPLGRTLDRRLEAAGLEIRPAEYVLLMGIGAILAVAAGAAFRGVLVGLLLGAGVVVGARAFTGSLAQRRQTAIAAQLPDTLQVLAGTLRSGYGLVRAVDMLADQTPAPTADEFRRLLIEVRLGRDLDDALRAMAQRIGLPDLEWVVQAIEIHREVGGDLAEVLDTVRQTVMEREQVRGQVRALSSQGRFSARILVGLPVIVVLALVVLRPEYISELTTEPLGWAMIGIGIALMTLGIIWIRRLVRLVF